MRTLLIATLLLFLAVPCYAGLRVQIGAQAIAGVGSNLQRADAGSINWQPGVSYLYGTTWKLLLDVDMPAGDDMPTSLGFAYVFDAPNAGDPDAYVGVYGISQVFREHEGDPGVTHMGAGARLGVLLPLSGQQAKLGFKGHWVQSEGWFAGFEIQYVDPFGGE